MNYHDLANDTAEKAWETFMRAEDEYKRDPQNRDKCLRAREAFKVYDAVRVKAHFPNDEQLLEE